MQTCFLDSNVLIYYKDDTATYHVEAVKLLEKIHEEDLTPVISPLVIDEVLHTALYFFRKHNPKTPHKELSLLLANILEIPKLTLVNPPTDLESTKKVIDLMEKYNLQPRDAYHLSTMQVNSIDTFATFDNDFKKVFAEKILKKF